MDKWDGRATLTEKYESERDHSYFLETLLRTLYGEGWEYLTLFDARKWHKKHFKVDSNEMV